MMHEPCHILLVDDDEITNFLSIETLRLYVPDVITFAVGNGKQALDFLRGQQTKGLRLPDIILLDINMPLMDGWEFLQEFEKIRSGGFENTRVFMFTSSVYFADINKAKSFASVSNIYSKPLDEKKIREMLK